jgi:integrase
MKSNQLTTRKVTTAKEPGYYGDGGGLYLQVSKTGTKINKSWIFRFMLNGKARDMGLGRFPDFTLKQARERARENRRLLADGIDPIEEKRKKLDATRSEATERMSFKDAAKRYIDLHEGTWKNEKHREQWRTTLREYAYPTLGDRPISAIDGALITYALSPIWTKTPVTAQRVKQRIERVVQWGKDGMPLPARVAAKPVQHLDAMPFAELPAFMVELRKRKGVSARALEFTILTAARTSEAIGAKWDEIDLDEGVWTVPAERMKAAKEHPVPLSKRAIEILKALPREGEYLFVGAKKNKPLYIATMLDVLREMRGKSFTVHGFRSTFRDWSGDRTNYAREVIEHALAHRIKDKAEASYRRTSALDKRRRLMEEWARYCNSPVIHSTGVVSISFAT